jgi:DNA modification methylase
MIKLYRGDSLAILRRLPDQSVQCCVTSPPYWGLRDYGVRGQLGLESTPEAYLTRMVEVFREVRRVLRNDGVLFLNMGDSFESKQLVGMPWRLAFALQADGWYLRSDIIWHKPNPMPESVTDRPTKAHEYVFLLTKSQRYFWDQEAVKENGTGRIAGNNNVNRAGEPGFEIRNGFLKVADVEWHSRNIRSVWTITPKPFRGAHFATFPPALVERCVKAGSKPGDVILDPFIGSGTVAAVSRSLGRDCIGIDLNPKYLTMARQRVKAEQTKVALHVG